MIGDEDKYATNNELTGYVLIILILMIFQNRNYSSTDKHIVKALKTHVDSNHRIWFKQLKVDSVNSYKWDRQYEIDSLFLHTLLKDKK